MVITVNVRQFKDIVLIIVRRHAGFITRFVIKWRFEGATEMFAQHVMPRGVVGQVALVTDILVIFSTRGDMGDFIMGDDF